MFGHGFTKHLYHFLSQIPWPKHVSFRINSIDLLNILFHLIRSQLLVYPKLTPRTGGSGDLSNLTNLDSAHRASFPLRFGLRGEVQLDGSMIELNDEMSWQQGLCKMIQVKHHNSNDKLKLMRYSILQQQKNRGILIMWFQLLCQYLKLFNWISHPLSLLWF